MNIHEVSFVRKHLGLGAVCNLYNSVCMQIPWHAYSYAFLVHIHKELRIMWFTHLHVKVSMCRGQHCSNRGTVPFSMYKYSCHSLGPRDEPCIAARLLRLLIGVGLVRQLTEHDRQLVIMHRHWILFTFYRFFTYSDNLCGNLISYPMNKWTHCVYVMYLLTYHVTSVCHHQLVMFGCQHLLSLNLPTNSPAYNPIHVKMSSKHHILDIPRRPLSSVLSVACRPCE